MTPEKAWFFKSERDRLRSQDATEKDKLKPFLIPSLTCPSSGPFFSILDPKKPNKQITRVVEDRVYIFLSRLNCHQKPYDPFWALTNAIELDNVKKREKEREDRVAKLKQKIDRIMKDTAKG